MRKLLSISLTVGALALTACGKLDEGVNAHDLQGTVVVPKALLGTNDVGMIYVGVYSGLDTRTGYPSPVAAPAQSSAGADTFPYGGTSIGTFANRDYRFICQRVSGQLINDAGANWELPFDVLQFPFYEGAVVWAWVDQYPFGSCNSNDGYSDYKQILVDMLDVQPASTAGQYVITLDQEPLVPTEPTLFSAHTDQADDCDSEPFDPEDPEYCQSTEFLDEGGNFWEVVTINESAKTITVESPVGGGGQPALNGGTQARLFLRWDEPTASGAVVRYGSQYTDVLNFPTVYIDPEDFVSGQTGSPVLQNLDPVTVTIDTAVAP